ncbi:hypothetical protein G7076_11115 [Sphingomonas sp. HDW15A]|uniref:hypothetical protein n=1 Tax=Sphingomonas sp. HDW15A TaxID=2714942 RepID=UPI001407FC0A|nr:hypothetical protein [Sphingomonas sp. HDW15A]QIK96896.1 hypothetical protein G7076_11115 [Sphingomonas sp. HDW15A]
MSAPIRFTGLVLFGWVGVRAASLGLLLGRRRWCRRNVPSLLRNPLQHLVSTPATQAFSEADPTAPAMPPYGYDALARSSLMARR